ncbi:MAG: ModD protein [Epsilonproteobacteria bacterium]|nr:ModD protein [Campylobacterota bacterium]
MFRLSDAELLAYVAEDVPTFDLTTALQGAPGITVSVELIAKEDCVVALSEEAARIVQLHECRVEHLMASSSHAKEGDVIVRFSGSYATAHKIYRSMQVLMEYGSKIATTTHDMLQKIRAINPKCGLYTTRKTYPLAKRFGIRGVLAGGGLPHRLGLSESVLFFEQHRILYPNTQSFYNEIEHFKKTACEKKVVVESHDFDDALALLEAGVDVLQLDKLTPETIDKIVQHKELHYSHAKILAAGGINLQNVAEFAATQVDGIVTSAPYLGGMCSISTKMRPL